MQETCDQCRGRGGGTPHSGPAGRVHHTGGNRNGQRPHCESVLIDSVSVSHWCLYFADLLDGYTVNLHANLLTLGLNYISILSEDKEKECGLYVKKLHWNDDISQTCPEVMC